jgi:hypothetical protein
MSMLLNHWHYGMVKLQSTPSGWTGKSWPKITLMFNHKGM